MVRVDPDARKGEFHHVGASNEAGTCRAQTRDGGGIFGGRRLVLQNSRARGGVLTLNVKQVFDGDGQTCQGVPGRTRLGGRVDQVVGGDEPECMLACIALRHIQACLRHL